MNNKEELEQYKVKVKECLDKKPKPLTDEEIAKLQAAGVGVFSRKRIKKKL